MVKQVVHLNTFRSWGQRTIELQVVQLPVIGCREVEGIFLLADLCAYLLLLDGVYNPSSDEDISSCRCCALLSGRLPPKSDGNGWLSDRV